MDERERRNEREGGSKESARSSRRNLAQTPLLLSSLFSWFSFFFPSPPSVTLQLLLRPRSIFFPPRERESEKDGKRTRKRKQEVSLNLKRQKRFYRPPSERRSKTKTSTSHQKENDRRKRKTIERWVSTRRLVEMEGNAQPLDKELPPSLCGLSSSFRLFFFPLPILGV